MPLYDNEIKSDNTRVSRPHRDYTPQGRYVPSFSQPSIGNLSDQDLLSREYSEERAKAVFDRDHPIRSAVSEGLISASMAPELLRDVMLGDFSKITDPKEFNKAVENQSVKNIITSGAEAVALEAGGEMAVAGVLGGASKVKGLFQKSVKSAKDVEAMNAKYIFHEAGDLQKSVDYGLITTSETNSQLITPLAPPDLIDARKSS